MIKTIIKCLAFLALPFAIDAVYINLQYPLRFNPWLYISITFFIVVTATVLLTAIKTKWYFDLAIGLWTVLLYLLRMTTDLLTGTPESSTYLLIASGCILAYAGVSLVRELRDRQNQP